MKPLVVDIDLSVKFRAFGITFGTLKRAWTVPIPDVFGHPRLSIPVLTFNERGVALAVRLRTAA